MRVLLVEDDKKIVAAVRKGLHEESFAVDLAEDGLFGEELAQTSDYDIIILDVMLPKQNGWQTCAALRKSGNLTPVLMLTVLDDVNDKIRRLNEGADDYLDKPFHFGELLARIRSLIRRNTDIRSAKLEKFGLVLDLNTHKAFRENTEIFLTAKEFAL